jgi:GNAT superfamily N-acetyltransferase
MVPGLCFCRICLTNVKSELQDIQRASARWCFKNFSLQETDFIIRPMRVADISSAMRLSTAEGWNQTEGDWRLFVESLSNICLVAEQDGKVIGTTTSIVYSDQLAWIAMVLVDKEYRGRGVSKVLLPSVMARLEFCRSIKLDATAAGQQVYKKFDFAEEYKIARMTTGRATKSGSGRGYNPIERIQSANIPEVVAFDKTVFGADRSQLIQYLIKQNPDKGWILKANERISGIALGRRGNKYHHIGPVLASDANHAKMLIETALDEIGQQPVVVDVLCDKQELIQWLESIGFTQQRTFIRMYKGHNAFPGEVDKQFLICGPEFG